MTNVTKPKLFLNRIEIDKKSCIKLYFWNNRKILDRIKTNDWIEFNAKYSVYFVEEKDNIIGLLTELFEDIAEVRIDYLDNVPRKYNLNKELIIGTGFDTYTMKKRSKLPTITINSVELSNGDYLAVKQRFPYDIYKRVLDSGFISWNKEKKLWYFKNTKEKFKKFFDLLSLDYKIKLSTSVKIRDTEIKQMLWEQESIKDHYFKSDQSFWC